MSFESLGTGLRFPIELNGQGAIAVSADADKVAESIRIILGTAKGERVMRPDFGAGLQALVFEPISATTMALVKHGVEEALVTWEPRIDVLEVAVVVGGGRNRLDVTISYRVRATNTFYNLVYPFYLLEGERA